MISAQQWAKWMLLSILSMSIGLILGSCVGMDTEPWGTLVWIACLGGMIVAGFCILTAITGNVIDLP